MSGTCMVCKGLPCVGCGIRFSQPGQFYGEGIGSLVAREAALKADAERLAELKREKDGIPFKLDGETAWTESRRAYERREALLALIAVYEECAARGLTFGGGR